MHDFSWFECAVTQEDLPCKSEPALGIGRDSLSDHVFGVL